MTRGDGDSKGIAVMVVVDPNGEGRRSGLNPDDDIRKLSRDIGVYYSLVRVALVLRTKNARKISCTTIKPHHMGDIESYRDFVRNNKGHGSIIREQ